MSPSVTLGGEKEWEVWRRARDLGMLLYLHTLPGTEQVDEVKRLVGELDLRVVIAHLGNAPHEGWQEQVRLAEDKRVAISCSAVPLATKEDFPAPKARDLLKQAVEMVGADKLLWGSDYPGTLTRLTYPQTLEWVRSYCTFLEPGQMAAILGGTAERISQGLWR
jgi:predicted TIM-barrel fold metal-dependent hydrolase